MVNYKRFWYNYPKFVYVIDFLSPCISNFATYILLYSPFIPMGGHTRKDRIRNEQDFQKINIAPILDKVDKIHFRWSDVCNIGVE